MDQKQRSIAEKYSLDYYRRSLPTRAWKSPWNYLALLLALLVLAGMYLMGRNTPFQAAPVARVHSSFGTNCASCHDQSWAAARRLATLSDVHSSVSDAACQKCHSAATHAAVPLREPACAACHQEHRPEKRLVEIADSACTRCHRDLAQTGVSLASFYPNIRTFKAGAGGHPEFALLRPGEDAVGPRHAARTLARFVGAAGRGRTWHDRSGLKFNHQMHLVPGGVLDSERKQTILTCADCHVNDPDGGYMRPIEYEQHCARCHPLSADAPLADIGDLPHSSIEEVRGVIRERLARQMEQSSAQPTPPESAPRLPRLPAPARLNADQERQLASQMELADHAVFGLEAKGMCRHCHHLIERDSQWHVLLENPAIANEEVIASPLATAKMVPARWMRHAEFNHKSHRAVECAQCHEAQNSRETADILLPAISICRTCHGSASRTTQARARDDCVLCHSYHSETHEANFEGVPLRQLFPEMGAAPVPGATP